MNRNTEYLITQRWARAETPNAWDKLEVILNALAFCRDDQFDDVADELHFLSVLACERCLMVIEADIQGFATMSHSPTLSLVSDCYYTADGEAIHVPCLDWLEDGRYYDKESEAWLACSRYYIGTGDDEDGSSVWLNADMVEVQP